MAGVRGVRRLRAGVPIFLVLARAPVLRPCDHRPYRPHAGLCYCDRHAKGRELRVGAVRMLSGARQTAALALTARYATFIAFVMRNAMQPCRHTTSAL